MTDAQFQRGDQVRIVRCPVHGQHDGQEAVVVDTYESVLRVELASGERCWPYRVEAVVDHQRGAVERPGDVA